MNNASTSECSSGCESGWTTYLDHLSNSTYPYTHQPKGSANVHDHEVDDDDDLSMVSDASSGPPHLHPPPPQRNQKTKTKETKLKSKKKQHSLCLDDTASSPFLHFSQGNAVPPENHHSISTAHFEEERMTKMKVGFFKSSGSLLGRKRQ
ncbi:protein SOB FIVE-LIKE 5-like isoform X2 [Salvia miltiorrhiza]|uniref:protein SOB FIVE-LIKE 5-like isoform X2 n=1 Tax=Salvia miltiorrhiza TaxID=226208 RepID=UPI0025AC7FC2|nr:protein SOB FIVE-LIKE 5-like isoform X2 [Salvia miltiorrhiza]